MKIRLIDLLNGEPIVYGSATGRIIYEKLNAIVEKIGVDEVISIETCGIENVDVTFVRESIGRLVYEYQGKRKFILINHLPKISSNWVMGLHAKEVSMVSVSGKNIDYIGKPVSEANKHLLENVRKTGEVTTVKIANELSLSVNNASTRLKKLVSEGLLIRNEHDSLTGGKEFIYRALL